MTQPEALRLADALDAEIQRTVQLDMMHHNAAAELRRLSAENAELWKEREEPHKTIEMYVRECNRLERERDEARRTVREAHEAGARLTAQRDALLALLGRIRAWDMMDTAADGPHWKREIDAAIKAVEGGS